MDKMPSDQVEQRLDALEKRVNDLENRLEFVHDRVHRMDWTFWIVAIATAAAVSAGVGLIF